jgi:hypothetical protein
MNLNFGIGSSASSDTPIYEVWQRPSDWLPIPDALPGEEVVYLLMAIFPGKANYVALNVNVGFIGDYYVDWGDGLGNVLFGAGVQAEKNYDYLTVDPLTITQQGYRQVLIKITPVNQLNFLNLNLVHTSLVPTKPSNLLDVVINTPNISGSNNLRIGGGNQAIHVMVERVWIRDIGAITSITGGFSNMDALQSVPLFDTSLFTDFSSFFGSCNSLQYIENFDTSSGQIFTSMFGDCYSLVYCPSLDLTSATLTNTMFTNCYALKQIEDFIGGANITATNSMFNACQSLVSAPNLNLISCTNATLMFQGCYALKEVPAYNFSPAGCTMLQMFQQCRSLENTPGINFSSSTSLSTAFSSAQALTTLIIPDLSLCTTLVSLTLANQTLKLLHLGNLDSVISTTNFAPSLGLQSVILEGLRITVNLSGKLLSDQAINDLFTSLGVASGAQTVNVSGNPGSGTCDPTIATAKGWTVTV